MGTMREEVVVEMGGDASGIERAIGVGKSYFNGYLDWVKTQEGQYSNWWNTELKKREEMGVASSVRAASRAIQARKLLRERETIRTAAAAAEQATANTVIGGGSIPAGWVEQAAAKKAARALEMKAAEALKDAAGGAHGSAGAFRELMVVVRELARGDMTRLPGSFSRLLGMVGLSIPAMLGIGVAVGEVVAIIWEAKKMMEAQKQEVDSITRLNEERDLIRKRLIGDVSNLEKAGRISATESETQRDLLLDSSPEALKRAQQFIRAHGGVVSDKDLKEMQKLDEEHAKKMEANRREDMYAYQREQDSLEKIAALKDDMSKMDKATLDYKKKQLELDDLERQLLKDQKDHEEEKLRIFQKQREEQRVYDEAKIHMKDIEQREREKFMPTLDELAHHGSFTGQARGISRLERRIKREFERGDTGGADRDIAARNKIYDSLADRGVVAERADRREIKELTAKMLLHIAAVAQGKAVVKVIPALR